jgi:hypothetical protein
MKVAQSVADVLRHHVTLEVEGIDRMYLNVYVPTLQTPEGVAHHLRFHRGHRFASSALLEPMTKAFVRAIERYAKRGDIPVITFENHERKDDVANARRAAHGEREGVVFIGKAQEKTRVVRTERRRNPATGVTYPFPEADRRTGCRCEVSIRQAEFSLTQVLDQPVNGRIFFEEVIRENLDLGRPSQVQLIFDRRIGSRTPGRFRTRVITDGVVPSLHVDYKKSRIKQYHKEGRALRTETTINDTRDFDIGRALKNLPQLRRVGFQANRRLLDVQRISHDCHLGESAFQQVNRPVLKDGQRASALRFADPKTQALLTTTVGFVLQPRGFTRAQLAERVGALSGSAASPGHMTYDLRRLRLHGIIKREAHSHRYRLTAFGLRTALFWTRSYARLLRTGMSELQSHDAGDSQLRRAFAAVERAVESNVHDLKLAS